MTHYSFVVWKKWYRRYHFVVTDAVVLPEGHCGYPLTTVAECHYRYTWSNIILQTSANVAQECCGWGRGYLGLVYIIYSVTVVCVHRRMWIDPLGIATSYSMGCVLRDFPLRQFPHHVQHNYVPQVRRTYL